MTWRILAWVAWICGADERRCKRDHFSAPRRGLAWCPVCRKWRAFGPENKVVKKR